MSTVDVIIPVYRPDDKLNRLLTALNRQTMKPEKIILMHTGEVTDGEPDYDRFPVELHLVSPEEFDHGGTRNRGAACSTAEIMIFMTQDAVPADDRLIERLVEAVNTPQVCVAYARQLPYPDCGAIERYTREFNYPKKDELRTRDDIAVRGIKTFCCSNVCAAYRRETFERLGGFEKKTIFNEDMLFAAKAVLQGSAVRYVGEAGVFHSHRLGLADQFHRNFDNGVSQAEHPEIFAAISSEKEGMKLVRYCVGRMKEEHRWYLLPYFLLNCGCRYLGFFLGKRYRKLPAGVVRACSLNKRYWRKAV